MPRRKATISGRRRSGPCGGRKEGPKGRDGSVTPPPPPPPALLQRGTMISPLGFGLLLGLCGGLLLPEVGLDLLPEEQHAQLAVRGLVHGLGLHAHAVLVRA